MHECPQVRLFLLHFDANPDCSAREHREEEIVFASFPVQQKCSLSQDRFACQQGRPELRHLIERPGVMRKDGYKETYERASID
jgi:hypothetical protein